MKLSKKQKIFKKILIIIVVVLIIVGVNVFQDSVRNFFYLISSPLQKQLWQASDKISDFFAGFFLAEKLAEEREELRLYNQELLARIIAFKELEEENKILRQALEIGLKKEFELILAQICGKDIGQDFLLLDRGSKDNVSKDQPVVTQEKVLCGKISQVYKDFSKLALVSNEKSSFDVKIISPLEVEAIKSKDKTSKPLMGQDMEITAILKGKGGQQAFLELIPREAEIELGDFVVTSSLGKVFPANLLVGKIKKILKSDVEHFQQAEVALSCDIKELQYLFIVSQY